MNITCLFYYYIFYSSNTIRCNCKVLLKIDRIQVYLRRYEGGDQAHSAPAYLAQIHRKYNQKTIMHKPLFSG